MGSSSDEFIEQAFTKDKLSTIRNALTIDKCIRCDKCVEACKPEAIDFNQKSNIRQLEPGQIIVATGFFKSITG